MPCSANALARALMAAFVAATAAKAGLGSRAALPDVNTTEPSTLSVLSAQVRSRVVHREVSAPYLLSIARPSSRTDRFVARPLRCSAARSIRPKRSRLALMSASADSILLKSSDSTTASDAFRYIIRVLEFRKASTMAEKSRANRIAVDRPIPWLAPVTIATDFNALPPSSGIGANGLTSDVLRARPVPDPRQEPVAASREAVPSRPNQNRLKAANM